mmetsp:Transcript_18752/g.20900  ORF Transcript_18752/g.20900 Transcript_18752/m.20900 type:complete len:126 (+) Transcript_18752:159-536(+)
MARSTLDDQSNTVIITSPPIPTSSRRPLKTQNILIKKKSDSIDFVSSPSSLALSMQEHYDSKTYQMYLRIFYNRAQNNSSFLSKTENMQVAESENIDSRNVIDKRNPTSRRNIEREEEMIFTLDL